MISICWKPLVRNEGSALVFHHLLLNGKRQHGNYAEATGGAAAAATGAAAAAAAAAAPDGNQKETLHEVSVCNNTPTGRTHANTRARCWHRTRFNRETWQVG